MPYNKVEGNERRPLHGRMAPRKAALGTTLSNGLIYGLIHLRESRGWRPLLQGLTVWVLLSLTRRQVDGFRINVGVLPEISDLAKDAVEHLQANDLIKIDVLPVIEEPREIDRLIKLYNKINHRSHDVIIGPYDNMIGLALTKLEIPYIVTSGGINASDRVFDVLPHPEDIYGVLIDVIREYKWTKIGVIFEADQDMRVIECLLNERPIDMKFWKLMGDPSIAMRDVLLANQDKGIEQTVVLMTASKTRTLLRLARKLGLINPVNEWLILNLESTDVSNHTLDYIRTNVTTINLVRHTSPWLRDITSRSAGRMVSTLEAAALLDAIQVVIEANRLLLTQPGPQMNSSMTRLQLAEVLHEVSFEGRTGMIHFDRNGKRINVTFSIYRFQRNAFVKVGDWVALEPPEPRLFFPTPEPEKDRNLSNAFHLRGKKLQVVTILEEPFTMLSENHHNMTGNARFRGFCVDLMEEITSMLGFQYELYLVPDGKFGSRNSDGSWNGMIGEVMAQRAAMTVAPLSINAEREKVIDFTKPFKTRGITVLMRTPKSHPSYFQFLKPLSPHVWLCTILAIVTVSGALYCLERYATAARANRVTCPTGEAQTMELQESCWFVFGSLVQGGTESSPVTLGGRVLTSAWWLFALMMVSTYTANLAAFLTVKKIQPPIASVTDLAGQTSIKFGTVLNSGVETFFKNTKIQAFVNMRTHMTELFPDAMVNSTEEGLRRVKSEDYAFLWDNTVTSYKASVDCDFTEIGPPFDPKGFGLAVPSGATYREDLSIAILRLGDQGKIVELEHKYWRSAKCGSQEKSGSNLTSELQLENVAGIFFILVAGIAFALCSCAFSSLYYRRRTRRPK